MSEPAPHAGILGARALRAHDVDTVFTLNGGHLWPLYDGCRAEGIALVDTRHEQTAAFAAEGWAKVTRRVGVAALTAGPGVTNGVSAITSAWMNGTPVFVVGGRAPGGRWGQGSLQELDHVPIVAPVTKYARTAFTPDTVGSEFDTALRSARSPHRGPTFVDVPLDAWGPSDAVVPGPIGAAAFAGEAPDPDAVAAVAAKLAGATKPVLMLGGDVYWAGAEGAALALVERYGLPVFVNDMARGVIPADHPNAFSRARGVAFAEADLVVVVGTPLDFRLGFGRFGDAEVIHIADSAEGVATHATLTGSVAGDLVSVLTALVDQSGFPEVSQARAARAVWIGHLRSKERAARAGDADRLMSDAFPIDPVRIYGELQARLDRDAIVIGDGGDFVSYAGRYVDTFAPGCFIGPGPYGCLGSGMGYALAAATAFPDRQVVLLLGDGAIGFGLGDLDTLARHGANVVGIVGNNSIWGLEKHPMQMLFGYDLACDLAPETRYDKVAEDLGCHGELVRGADEIGPALDRAFAHVGPSLVNVMTDPADAYPRSSNLG
ncbi:MAG: acetolactate synthase [Acidimicrobiia bacterium]|jgi:acetolactate synthase-1/2/3 large subunit